MHHLVDLYVHLRFLYIKCPCPWLLPLLLLICLVELHLWLFETWILMQQIWWERLSREKKKDNGDTATHDPLTTSWSSRDTISSSFWCPFLRSSSVLFRASSSAWALSISSFILQRSLSLTAEIRDARMVSSPMVPSLLGPLKGDMKTKCEIVSNQAIQNVPWICTEIKQTALRVCQTGGKQCYCYSQWKC